MVLAGTAQHELPFAEPGDRGVDRRHVDAARRRRHALEQPGLVALGLEAADHPRAGVRHRLVVEVDRVLRRQHHPDTERPGLLHQRHDRLLRRRVLGGREIPRHLVHVEHRPQIGRAALAAHPRHQLGEHERRHELALLVGQVSRRHDRAAGTSVGLTQHRLDVERRAQRPRRERRRRQQAVELHRQRHAVVRGEELVDVEHAELADRWRRDHPDERHQVERPPLSPRMLDEVRQQDVLPARQRIGGDADQSEQAGDVPLDLVGDRLGIAHVGRYLQRPDDVQRHARLRAGRVDREVGLLAQRTDVGAAETPAGEPLGPQRRLARGELVGRLTGVAGLRLVDPRPEVGGSEGGKRETEVGEVALRIDRQHRESGPQRLLDEDHPEAGLARPGHADDDPVGGQRIGRHRDVAGCVGRRALVGRRVDRAAEEQVCHGPTVAVTPEIGHRASASVP